MPLAEREDISHVIITHYDFDHAGGMAMREESGAFLLHFPLKGSPNLELVNGEAEIVRGVRVIHTGGHTKGYQIVIVESGGKAAVYLCDLLPTHAHFNPIRIMAYDNFLLDSIQQEEGL